MRQEQISPSARPPGIFLGQGGEREGGGGNVGFHPEPAATWAAKGRRAGPRPPLEKKRCSWAEPFCPGEIAERKKKGGRAAGRPDIHPHSSLEEERKEKRRKKKGGGKEEGGGESRASEPSSW